MSYEAQQIRDLRQRVGLLERKIAFLLEQLHLEYVDQPSDDVDPDVFALVKAGKSIDAIKLYRERTGAESDHGQENHRRLGRLILIFMSVT